jgi:transcriptional regulator with XRE-family HTH domain
METTDRLKQLRKYLRLSQKELSEQIGLKQSYYSDVENGKRNLTAKIADSLKKNFNISSDWLMHDIGDMKLTISDDNMTVSDSGINDGITRNLNKPLTKEDLNVFFEALIASQYKGEGKVDYYYKHSTHKIDIILSNLKKELETVYNDNVKLITVSEKFGAPPFMHGEKFPQPDDFKDYIKKQNADFKEDNEDISDPKLLKCIKIVAYEEDIENWRRLLSYLIDYMHQYYDIYDTLFEKYHSSPNGHKKD